MLELPVDEAFLDRLAAEAAPHHQGYRIVGFAGACPDEYVAAYCALKAAMLTEAPMGDLEMDPEVWDEARLREEEAELDGHAAHPAERVRADCRTARSPASTSCCTRCTTSATPTTGTPSSCRRTAGTGSAWR